MYAPVKYLLCKFYIFLFVDIVIMNSIYCFELGRRRKITFARTVNINSTSALLVGS